ncbi:hypothetical protein Ahy_A03g015961 [Arachis hypogaea]|uniref:Polynucleotide adenylyltransferase n=1 Tax=Arachis hypogaea TaxID=3818 RepID=A0A445E1W9_ARAHY|nr:hypothetical protein Ahy_A03g015961 [Arachis hypogaea]
MEMRSFMPIFLSSSSYEFCHSNITKSTFNRIRTEFVRGCNMTSDLLKPDKLFLYSKRYFKFVKIYLCTTNQCELRDWVGWVKSRFHSLLGFCDPSLTKYTNPDKSEPNVIQNFMFEKSRVRYLMSPRNSILLTSFVAPVASVAPPTSVTPVATISSSTVTCGGWSASSRVE